MNADTPMAAACSNVRLAGFVVSASSEVDAYSAKAPLHEPKTSSPGFSRVTLLADASTVPAMSVPGTRFFALLIENMGRMTFGTPRMVYTSPM